MTLIAVTSAKGGPGATTVALGLAAAWRRQAGVLLGEADSAGGDLALRLDVPVEPGVVSLAAACRDNRSVEAFTVQGHTRRLRSGIEVLVAPAGADQAGVALTQLARVRPQHPLEMAARQAGRVVIADIGRMDPAGPAWPVLRAADRVLVVTRARVEDIAHIRHRLARLDAAVAATVGLVVVGDGYPPSEIATALGVPVDGQLPRDARGADLVAAWAGRNVFSGRVRLARHITTLAEGLRGTVPELGPPRAHEIAPPRSTLRAATSRRSGL